MRCHCYGKEMGKNDPTRQHAGVIMNLALQLLLQRLAYLGRIGIIHGRGDGAAHEQAVSLPFTDIAPARCAAGTPDHSACAAGHWHLRGGCILLDEISETRKGRADTGRRKHTRAGVRRLGRRRRFRRLGRLLRRFILRRIRGCAATPKLTATPDAALALPCVTGLAGFANPILACFTTLAALFILVRLT